MICASAPPTLHALLRRRPCRLVDVRAPAGTARRLSLHQQPSPPRTYLYDLDLHGQLFLSDSKHRNVATAFRDARFLDVFFARMRRNEGREDEAAQLRLDGYEFVSPCEGEMNYLRPHSDGSGVVFQALEDGELHYAGTLTISFDADALRVDPATGYLFHPSPRSRRNRDAPSRYGPFSLLRSSLVIEHFAKSLELDEEGGGSFAYAGRRHLIAPLEDGDVWQRRARSLERP